MVHANYTTEVAMTSMSMRSYPGRTHRFIKVPVLYPFGYGLSYTHFSHTLTATVGFNSKDTGGLVAPRVIFTVTAMNVGDVVSDHVILVFLSLDEERLGKPAAPTALQLLEPVSHHKSPAVVATGVEAQRLLGTTPTKELVWFRRAGSVDPGSTVTYQVELTPSKFELTTVEGDNVFVRGAWRLHLGPSGTANAHFDTAS
jgi:hypothetical protein